MKLMATILDSVALKDLYLLSNSTFSSPDLIRTENPTWIIVVWVLSPSLYSQGQLSFLDAGYTKYGLTLATSALLGACEKGR